MLWLEIFECPESEGIHLRVRADDEGVDDLLALLTGEPVRLLIFLPVPAPTPRPPRRAGIRSGRRARGTRRSARRHSACARARGAMLQRRRRDFQIWRSLPARRTHPPRSDADSAPESGLGSKGGAA